MHSRKPRRTGAANFDWTPRKRRNVGKKRERPAGYDAIDEWAERQGQAAGRLCQYQIRTKGRKDPAFGTIRGQPPIGES